MPTLPLGYCTTPGCRNRADGKCPSCSRTADIRRGTRHQRGYTNRWAAYSRARLARHPWCVGYPAHQHEGLAVLATCTDHIVSAKARPDLFWAEHNHQSLCAECNSRKNIAEEGGLEK